MSSFVVDALGIGVKEGIKLGVVWLLFAAWLAHGVGASADRKKLMAPFSTGLSLAVVVFLASFLLPATTEQRAAVAAWTAFSFGVLYLLSLGALFEAGRAIGLERVMSLGSRGWLASTVVAVGACVYFAPDVVASTLYLRELVRMADDPLPVFGPAVGGFAASLAVLYAVFRKSPLEFGRYFGLGQLLLFLALIKLLAGGSMGVGSLSLIPTVQQGAMQLLHDLVHQTFVILMIPDHPLFKVEVWNYIGLLFGSNAGMGVALAVLVGPPAWFVFVRLTEPVPVVEGEVAGPARRLRLSNLRALRTGLAMPVISFVLVVLASWYTGSQEKSSNLVLPAAKPVVVDRGKIIIPLTDPTMDLHDGKMHKFSVAEEGKVYRFFVIEKSAGDLAVTLDACAICPPEGYGVSEDKVVCVYCATPIPIDSLGGEGGCNPIPINSEITDRSIVLQFEELQRKWPQVDG